ncbi:hypothetical protein CB0940_06579 [Cercospora beticola]|uniref:Uncharacterized protein n=1 Tax=Cercospora beticola TaxID=122368 RepID=A0A2G5HZC8_CERBT|nr:hypothetical protein CB0940_06579 [Cercospora beticola]PIA97894.1 hypothetical protein CB0940_06579 [Cercospora beticola]WPA99224.1 hypothetical protein RHO25_003840 [Cercospora beticola]
MGDTNIAIRNDDQQVLLAALFGVLTTVLAVASVIVGYLQLRKYRLAHAVADVEGGIDVVSLAEIPPHGDTSLTPNIAAPEHQMDEPNAHAPLPPEVEKQ